MIPHAMFVRSQLALAALVCCGAAAAAPFSVVGETVGNMVSFTVSDADAAGGLSATYGFYQIEFSFSYDAAALQYLHADAVSLDGLLVAPFSFGDPAYVEPNGSFQAQFINLTQPADNAPLFKFFFQAKPNSGAGTTSADLTQSPIDVYGDIAAGGTIPTVLATGSAQVPAVSAVPEPESWALMLLGGALVAGWAGRGRRASRA
jgi:hypothetical protein